MSLADWLLPLLGLLTGFLLGMLGSGGSILALPAFLYAAHLPVKEGVATSLAVVGATSLMGAIIAQRRCKTVGCPGQEIEPRLTALLAAGGLVGAYAGARASALLSDQAQMLLFGAAVLLAAQGMLRRALGKSRGETVGMPPAPARPVEVVFLVGLGVGMLTGAVGVGGGFLIVPAVTLIANVPMKRATAMSLWVIAANCATGLLGYLGRVPVAWNYVGIFLVASLLGLFVGQHFARGMRPQKLQMAFAVFLLLFGVFTVAKTALTPSSSAPPRKPAEAAHRLAAE